MGELINSLMKNDTKIIAGIIILLVVMIINLFCKTVKQQKKIESTIRQAEEDVTEAENKARDEIAAVRAACENDKNNLIARHNLEMKRLKERIENKKEVLSQMDEKELLANVMLALDGYASRLNRIESHLMDDQITKPINQLLQGFKDTIEGFSDTLSDQIDDMTSTIQDSLNNSDVIEKLDEIESNLGDLSSEVYDIKSSVSYGFSCSCSSDIDDVKECVNSIKYTVDDINSNIFDGYRSESLASQIESIQYAADAAKDAAERARDAVESRL